MTSAEEHRFTSLSVGIPYYIMIACCSICVSVSVTTVRQMLLGIPDDTEDCHRTSIFYMVKTGLKLLRDFAVLNCLSLI